MEHNVHIIITHGVTGVTWTIVDKNGHLVATANEHHLTEKGARDEAARVLATIEGGKTITAGET